MRNKILETIKKGIDESRLRTLSEGMYIYMCVIYIYVCVCVCVIYVCICIHERSARC